MAGRQTLELKCDGIAALTLLALRRDLSPLRNALRKMTNEAMGATAGAAGYPKLRDRQEFVRALLEKIRRRAMWRTPAAPSGSQVDRRAPGRGPIRRDGNILRFAL